jgi:DnaJ-class molecular chaperone
MDNILVPERYGMVICPLCRGKGFLIINSDQVNVTLRSVCTICGGFGAIKKKEKIFGNLGNRKPAQRMKLA